MGKNKNCFSAKELVNVQKVMDLRREVKDLEEVLREKFQEVRRLEKELTAANRKVTDLSNELSSVRSDKFWRAGYAGLLKKLMLELHEDKDTNRFVRYLEKLCRFEGDAYAPWVEYERRPNTPLYSRGIAKTPQIYPELRAIADSEEKRKMSLLSHDWYNHPKKS